MKPDTSQYVFSSTNSKRYTFPTHVNELVIDRSQSETSEVFLVLLNPGQSPPLHKHDDTEQVFYILEGAGTLTIGDAHEEYAVAPGDVVRIPPSTLHAIKATGGELLRYVAIDCFPGGRPSAEPTWDAHVKAVCQQQGWDFGKVSS
ncbi:MAG: cupin domain-containing protein [Terrimicrobiaceae bacterium]